jgi:pyruvate dehydrogenase E1 component alpha subunit
MNDKLHLDKAHLLEKLKQMLSIRLFEEKCAELYTQEKIRGFLHLYIGEEAIAVGVMAALSAEDQIVATYREHGHALARGLSMKSVLAEMYGRTNGCSKGRGGSMHLFDKHNNFYGGNAIVGGGLPLAAGLAMANKMQATKAITVCFFGEGAVAEGEFHEAMNLAVLWQLPVLFVCENNGYAMGTALAFSESEINIAKKAKSYGMSAEQVDGMNVVNVEAAAIKAVDTIKTLGQPYFLECQSYRFRGHSSFDGQLYRDKEEVQKWQKHGPVIKLKHWLRKNYQLNGNEFSDIELEIKNEILDAIAFAELGQLQAVEDLCKDVYSQKNMK